MIESSGWSQEDTAALNEYSISEYVEWLRNEKDDRLLHVLKDFVVFFNPGQSTPDGKSVGEKIFAAFRVLCKDNDFIRYKLVNNVGVSPDFLADVNSGSIENSAT